MEIVIKRINYKTALILKNAYKAEGLKLRDFIGMSWLGAYDNTTLIGVVAYRRTKKGIVFKSDIVLKEYRGMGVYRKLFTERLKRIKKIKGTGSKRMYAYCTQSSLSLFLEYGFVKKRTVRRYTYVEYNNIK
ncbi:GNAT family N-acetyltransferase [Alteribacter keqinensis]|uniref:GNAT family N-acetyltransferase n=1 Tax=Alteribacter keqinensis TaxID=2483800 RepID=A0A3M7TRC7_9BACI|nr:GNAT family N-acetyltransferase [Alteribacter keqinensis]RNA67981.1 GNAT family N-acetyltransferase [Alteribacter keqinensis]